MASVGPGPLAVGLTFDLDFWQYLLGSWALAACTAAMVRGFARQPWHKAAGIGIMSVPLWATFLGILESIAPLLAGGAVLRPLSTYQLSTIYSRGFLTDLGYTAVGFVVYASGGRWGTLLALRTRGIARQLADAGLPTGRRSEGQSIAIAWLGFPLLLAGAIAVDQLASTSEALTDSDESSLWENMTPYHAVLIAMAAGFGEELLFRGFLQTALSRVMPTWLALGAQATLFAFAHAGYGNWAHVLSPFLFGLAVGLVAWRFGLWAAITLHVLVDVYAFGAWASEGSPWFGWALTLLLLANVAATIGWGLQGAYHWLRRRMAPPAAS